MFRKQYATVLDGDAHWQGLKFPAGDTYGWEPDSTYIRKAPYFDGMTAKPEPVDGDQGRARAGGAWRLSDDRPYFSGGLDQEERSGGQVPYRAWRSSRRTSTSYGSRRGNHEVMVRGTFANMRLRNKLAPQPRAACTRLLPEGTEMSHLRRGRGVRRARACRW